MTGAGAAFADLMNDVAANAPDKWRSVAIMLKISPEQVTAISDQHSNRPLLQCCVSKMEANTGMSLYLEYYC